MGLAKIPSTAVEQSVSQPIVANPVMDTAVKSAPKAAPSRAGYNQPLTEYDLHKDKQIGVAGVVQAVISSDWYAQIANLTDLNNPEAVAALRKLAEDEATHWLAFIQEKSA